VRVTGDPAEAVEGADLVVTMLSDGRAVEEVVRDAFAAVEDRLVWWQCSTVGVADIERFEHLAAEHGAVLVDAPVLGTKQPAEQGQLVVLASGPDEALDLLEEPVFGPVAGRILRLGAAGAGTRTKLVCNHWLAALVAGIAETIKLAQALDVDPHAWLDAIAGGPLDVGYAKVKGEAIMQGDFTPSFRLDLAAKDVDLVLQAAERQGIDLALAPVILERLRAASEAGYGNEDLTAIARL
jgi:3-hydroxyisobutyrate dehydrogenase